MALKRRRRGSRLTQESKMKAIISLWARYDTALFILQSVVLILCSALFGITGSGSGKGFKDTSVG